MQRLKSNTNEPRDLKGRRVAVLQGTTGLDHMNKEGADIDVFEGVDDAIAAFALR
jgi:ABC-type amino acid transport substrate-binding protein